jgi:two-component system, chemotaxis family, protein-glutamate methylesterase/glutaminase
MGANGTTKKGSAKKKAADFPIVAIGASAGGFNALLDLAEHLPVESEAAILVVQHLSELSDVTFLVQHLQKFTAFKCRIAHHHETIQPRTLYFGVRGMHLMLSKNKIVYGTGPDENNFKPSIDVLLRAVAVEYRERSIGIILSGLMDDGVAGMVAIKKCGGICIVQDPAEAQYPALPLAVIEKMKPDYTIPLADMGKVILDHAQMPRKKSTVPDELKEEAEIARNMLTDIDHTKKLGIQSLFTCPDCGGSLFHVQEGKLSRYRCFTGHAFTENTLLSKQQESIDSTLWIALRLMEEKKKLLEKFPTMQRKFNKAEIDAHISQLKNLLSDLVKLKGNERTDVQHPADLN